MDEFHTRIPHGTSWVWFLALMDCTMVTGRGWNALWVFPNLEWMECCGEPPADPFKKKNRCMCRSWDYLGRYPLRFQVPQNSTIVLFLTFHTTYNQLHLQAPTEQTRLAFMQVGLVLVSIIKLNHYGYQQDY